MASPNLLWNPVWTTSSSSSSAPIYIQLPNNQIASMQDYYNSINDIGIKSLKPSYETRCGDCGCLFMATNEDDTMCEECLIKDE